MAGVALADDVARLAREVWRQAMAVGWQARLGLGLDDGHAQTMGRLAQAAGATPQQVESWDAGRVAADDRAGAGDLGRVAVPGAERARAKRRGGERVGAASGKLSPASVNQHPAVVTPPGTGDLGRDVLIVLREAGWPLTVDEIAGRVDTGAAGVADAVPASGVAVSGDSATYSITVSGGTGTNVTIGGVSQGTFDGTYTLLPGQSIVLTYTVAPSWTWTIPVAFIPAKNADGSPVSRTGHG